MCKLFTLVFECLVILSSKHEFLFKLQALHSLMMWRVLQRMMNVILAEIMLIVTLIGSGGQCEWVLWKGDVVAYKGGCIPES